MLKKFLLVLAGVIALILIYAATRPATFTFERSTTIKAPPETIQAFLVDFHKWSAWSPWEKLDPNMKRTYEGPASGPGAIYSWEGNSDVGAGRMEITGVAPNKVNVKLDFKSPMEANDMVAFTLHPQGDNTQVVWSMSGDNNYMSKLMQVFVSMDTLIGKDFESGLADLKTAAEKAAAAKPADAPAAP